MTPSANDFLKAMALLAVLAAGSCANPLSSYDPNLTDDPAINHPILVQPNYHAIRLPFSAPQAGLMPDDTQHFDAFVAAYLQHGNGAISISAPEGGQSQYAISYFAERLASAGVPRERILVGTAASNDGKVELGYIGYDATTAPCGNFPDNLGNTAENKISPNLGCAIQHNFAAQIADPRDLVAPEPMGPGDAARRATVYGNYKDGKPTGAALTQDQSGAVADVNKQ
ncbi:MAG: CpaD family pilus assembly protein [Rhizomicrobium sp.]